MGCGLTWDVPYEWQRLPREDRINRIKATLRIEMKAPGVNTRSIRTFLSFLQENTAFNWRHLFITTNWDYLLQREIVRLSLSVLPAWLESSHVFHVNGTVEDRLPNHNRSPFLLPEDPKNQRTWSTEANVAFNKMIWQRTFVVVGMSFECATDGYLLHHLNSVEDDLPIGESHWVIVNPDGMALDAAAARIRTALPSAKTTKVCETFAGWNERRFPELSAKSIFS